MTAKELAKECSCSLSWVYRVRIKLGHWPTAEEIKARKGKIGRPLKYK